MTSTSSEPVVLRRPPEDAVREAAAGGDLRTGAWTRLGGPGVLGDAATERTLQGLAEQSRAAARAQGYAAGWAQGLQAARERADDVEHRLAGELREQAARAATDQRTALASLGAAAARCQDATEVVRRELLDGALDLALELVEAILGHEAGTAPGADALRRALLASPVDVPVVVRLHPDDLAALDPAVAAELVAGRDVRTVADPGLQRGDALAETGDAVVDATLGAALARVREVLHR